MSRVPYKSLLPNSKPSSDRGTYPSRAQITMRMFQTVSSIFCRRRTLALLGAFLIHVTLGTFYTLSNINSYMTSYLRLHGFPNTTYAGAIWISCAFGIGQGIAMILGGLLEKRFSARLSCFLGCILHSLFVMLTSMSLKYGLLAIVISYGFFPGFGTGLAYMTPMSNAFGWFDNNQKGMVAGTILGGFGIGTFVFNMVQTAYVNPKNLEPNAEGYFTQTEILEKVPDLLLFLGIIYALMQFVGCMLIFEPPIRAFRRQRSNATTIGKAFSSDQSNNGYYSCRIDNNDLTDDELYDYEDNNDETNLRIVDEKTDVWQAVKSREFVVLCIVYGTITQGILFVNSMIKQYGQTYIKDDHYLAWAGSMASIANSLGRVFWGLTVDRVSFRRTFLIITLIFCFFIVTLPFDLILTSKLLYLIWTLGIFGSFSGWTAIFPVQVAREFGRTNSTLIYGLVFVSQTVGNILLSFVADSVIDSIDKHKPCYFIGLLQVLGIVIYYKFYPNRN